MSKDYSIFNEIDVDFNEYGEAPITEEEKDKIKSRLNKKLAERKNCRETEKAKNNKIKSRLAASILIITLCGTAALTNKNVLASIKYVGRQIESFFDKKEGTYEKYKKPALQEASDKGISLKLREVMLGDEELVTNLSIDSSNIDREAFGIKYKGKLNIIPKEFATVNIDGQELKRGSSSGSFRYNEDGTVDALATFGIENLDLSKNYKMNIVCTKMEVQIPYKERIFIEGNWPLNFEIDGKALSNELKIIPINKMQTIKYKNQNYEISIKEIRISPLSWRLKYNIDMSKIVIDGNQNLDFKILDEKDNVIKFFSGGGSDDRGFSYEYVPKENQAIPKKIKIIPQIVERGFLKDKIVNFKENMVEVDLADY